MCYNVSLWLNCCLQWRYGDDGGGFTAAASGNEAIKDDHFLRLAPMGTKPLITKRYYVSYSPNHMTGLRD